MKQVGPSIVKAASCLVILILLLAIVLFFSNLAESKFSLKGKIAFHVWWLGGRRDLYVINADGTDLRLLVKDAYSPSMSPDARRLVYTKIRVLELRIINTDGHGEVRLAGGIDAGAIASLPAWSPDGRWIAYLEKGPDFYDIVRIRSDGGQKEKLFGLEEGKEETRLTESRPSWAPDSRRMVISLGPNDGTLRFALYILDVESKTLVQLTDLNQHDQFPTWSPDGKYIAFLRDWKLHLVDVQTGEIRHLTTNRVSSPVFSPDGKIVGFSREGQFLGIRLQDNKEEPILAHALKDLKDMWLLSFSWVDPELFSVDFREKLLTPWGKIKSEY